MTFHLNCRYALVTYPQCGDLQPQRLVEHFTALGSDIIIGREAHADGGTHLHVFADFNGSFEVDRLLYLMWTVTTRTSHLVRVHQRRVTTMRSRMETLSEGLSQDLSPAELEMGRLAINGLSLRVQRLVTTFGSWLTNWIRSLQSALSTNSRNGATGDLHLYALPISTHEELNLWSRTMTEDIRGYCNLALDLENHS